jgi:hypothetical protein
MVNFRPHGSQPTIKQPVVIAAGLPTDMGFELGDRKGRRQEV